MQQREASPVGGHADPSSALGGRVRIGRARLADTA